MTLCLKSWCYSGHEFPLSKHEDRGHCFVINYKNSFILGMAKEAAEQAYITKVEQMKGTYGFWWPRYHVLLKSVLIKFVWFNEYEMKEWHYIIIYNNW